MNKEYYKKLINEEINYLIEKKDDISMEISEIATFLGEYTNNVDLGRLDISAINEKRNQMKVIYDLIDDLEDLKNKGER